MPGFEQSIQVNLLNVLGFISLIAPFLVPFLLVTFSIMNGDLKGLVYLFGLSSLFVIILLFQNLHRSANQTVIPVIPNTSPLFYKCGIFDMTKHSTPSFNSALFTFTIAYIIAAMMDADSNQYFLISMFLLFYINDTIIKLKNDCVNGTGILLGSIVGTLWGIFLFLLIKSINKELLYYSNTNSNLETCSLSSATKFSCTTD